MKNKKIWIAIITHRHGITGYAAETSKLLGKQLDEYVKEYWIKEMGDIKIPDIEEERLYEYFDKNDDRETLDVIDDVELIEEEDNSKKIVLIGTITHEYGSVTYIGKDEKELNEKIDEYVKEKWEKDKEKFHRGNMPLNIEERIDKYFDSCLEEIHISETEIG